MVRPSYSPANLHRATLFTEQMSSHKYDDTSPNIHYIGTWRTGGVEAEYASTTHVAEDTGSQFSMTFEGVSVEVYGTITLSEAVSQYSVDSASPSTFTAPLRVGTEYGKLFFRSPRLPSGTHTLHVTSLTDKAFYVDFLIVTTEGEDAGLSSPNPSPTTQTRTATEKPMVSVGSTPQPSLPPPLNTKSNDNPGSPVGTILNSHISPTPNTDQGSLTHPTPPGTQLSPTPGPDPLSTAQTSRTSNALPLGSPPVHDMPSSNRLPTGIVAGSAIAGVVVIAVIVFFLWCYRRRSARYAVSSTHHSRVRTGMNSSIASVRRFTTGHYNGDISPFVHLPSPIDNFTSSALNDGHVSKLSPPDSPTFTRAPPATSTLEAGIRYPFSAVRWGPIDDSAPPAYSQIPEIRGI